MWSRCVLVWTCTSAHFFEFVWIFWWNCNSCHHWLSRFPYFWIFPQIPRKIGAVSFVFSLLKHKEPPVDKKALDKNVNASIIVRDTYFCAFLLFLANLVSHWIIGLLSRDAAEISYPRRRDALKGESIPCTLYVCFIFFFFKTSIQRIVIP